MGSTDEQGDAVNCNGKSRAFSAEIFSRRNCFFEILDDLLKTSFPSLEPLLTVINLVRGKQLFVLTQWLHATEQSP